jgi:hypothetical protein
MAFGSRTMVQPNSDKGINLPEAPGIPRMGNLVWGQSAVTGLLSNSAQVRCPAGLLGNERRQSALAEDLEWDGGSLPIN